MNIIHEIRMDGIPVKRRSFRTSMPYPSAAIAWLMDYSAKCGATKVADDFTPGSSTTCYLTDDGTAFTLHTIN